MEDNKKYYISSDGTKKDISTMHTSYLINAVNKKRNALFECQTSEEVMEALDQIEMLDQEYYKRVHEFLTSSFNEKEDSKNE